MTIEELKDLIDNTINENGAKAITGHALNLALNEITNAVAEAAATGGSAAKIECVGTDPTHERRIRRKHNGKPETWQGL